MDENLLYQLQKKIEWNMQYWPSMLSEEWRMYLWKNERARFVYMQEQHKRDHDERGRFTVRDDVSSEPRTSEPTGNGSATGPT